MAQTSAFHSPSATPDFDQTLVMAIELSSTKWVLAAQVPGLPRLKAKRTIEPTAEALLAAIESYRERAKRAGHTVQRVIATYEVSWSGFWLAHLIRWAGGIGWRAWVKCLVWRKVWVLRPTLMPDRNCHARHARRYAAWVLLASHWRQEGHCRL